MDPGNGVVFFLMNVFPSSVGDMFLSSLEGSTLFRNGRCEQGQRDFGV